MSCWLNWNLKFVRHQIEGRVFVILANKNRFIAWISSSFFVVTCFCHDKYILKGFFLINYHPNDLDGLIACWQNEYFVLINFYLKAMALKDEETRRFLWGRADDESCIRDFQDKTNSSTLAQTCGIFSRYYFNIGSSEINHYRHL